MADTVKVALLGLGTIGSGVYKLIERQQEEMSSKAGASIEIAAILVHNLGKERFCLPIITLIHINICKQYSCYIF